MSFTARIDTAGELALQAAERDARADLVATFEPLGALALIWAAHAAEHRARVAARSAQNGRRWKDATLVRLALEARALQPDELLLHQSIAGHLALAERRIGLLASHLVAPGVPESWCTEARAELEHEEREQLAQDLAEWSAFCAVEERRLSEGD